MGDDNCLRHEKKLKEKDAEIAKRDERIKELEEEIRVLLRRIYEVQVEACRRCGGQHDIDMPCDGCRVISRSPEAPEIIATETKEYEMTGGGKARIIVSIIKTPEAPARERAESRGSQRDGATVNPEPQRISSAPEETMECTCCRINMKKKKYKDGGEYWNCPQCDKVYDIVPK